MNLKDSNSASPLLQILDETVQKSLIADLRKYILPYRSSTDFVLASDYCLNDRGKWNDVISFTVAPAWAAADQHAIERFLPRDLKKTRSINKRMLGLFKSPIFFHLSVVIRNLDGLTRHSEKSHQEVTIAAVRELATMVEGWIKNQPEGEEKFTAQSKRFRSWVRELEKRSPNLTLFRHIVLVSSVGGYLAYLLSNEAAPNAIVWMSDRDKIVRAYGGVAYDLFEIVHFGLCDTHGIPTIPKIGLAIDELDGANLWFDPILRMPDYLAGTLASLDFKKNVVQHGKHSSILQGVFADSPFCSTLILDAASGSISWSRQTMSLMPSRLPNA